MLSSIEVPSSTKTEVASFRMSQSTVTRLKKEAREKRLSMNALVNQIVLHHAECQSMSTFAKTMPFPKSVLVRMINSLDEDAIRKSSEVMANLVFTELVYMKATEYTLESLIDTLLIWSEHSGFVYRDFFEQGHRAITINHNMGRKWSVFMMSSLQKCLGELTKEKVAFEITDNIIVIRI
jgi:hypothetical protein